MKVTVEIEKTCPLGQLTLYIPEAEFENKTATGAQNLVREQIEAAIIEETAFNFQTSVRIEKDSERLR